MRGGPRRFTSGSLANIRPHLTGRCRSLSILRREPGPQRECLNLKNVWAGSKLPGILVQRPKGVMRVRQNRGQTAESSREGEDSMDGMYTHRETEVHTNGEPRGTKRVRLQQQGIGQWTGGRQRVMWTQ